MPCLSGCTRDSRRRARRCPRATPIALPARNSLPRSADEKITWNTPANESAQVAADCVPRAASERMMASTFAAECNQREQAEFIPFLHELIGTALQVIGPLFLAGATVSTKSDASPVTAADRGAEEAMRRLIETRYPQHGIIGEEFGVKESSVAAGSGPRYRWVLDPVDGTRAFIS